MIPKFNNLSIESPKWGMESVKSAYLFFSNIFKELDISNKLYEDIKNKLPNKHEYTNINDYIQPLNTFDIPKYIKNSGCVVIDKIYRTTFVPTEKGKKNVYLYTLTLKHPGKNKYKDVSISTCGRKDGFLISIYRRTNNKHPIHNSRVMNVYEKCTKGYNILGTDIELKHANSDAFYKYNMDIMSIVSKEAILDSVYTTTLPNLFK